MRRPQELHQYVRDRGRKNKNDVISRISRLNACRTSGVLVQRGMNPVKVEKEQFIASVSDTRRAPKLAMKFNSASHRLPAAWSKMMRPNRTWPSPDNANSRIPFGAFVWATHYYGNYVNDAAVTIGAGQMACLLLNFTLLRRIADNRFFVTLSKTEHAAVAAEVSLVTDGMFRADAHDVVELYATRPEGEYEAIPWVAVPLQLQPTPIQVCRLKTG